MRFMPSVPVGTELCGFKLKLGFPGWRIHYYAWSWFKLRLPWFYCGWVVKPRKEQQS